MLHPANPFELTGPTTIAVGKDPASAKVDVYSNIEVASSIEDGYYRTLPRKYVRFNGKQLAEMAAGGVTMAGHTRTHPILSQVEPEQAHAEIAGSRADLGERLGEQPGWFAYPQGGPADFTPATVEMVRKAGYRGSYVAYHDPACAGRPFARHRYHAVADWTDFRWVVCGADYLVLKLRGLLGQSTSVSPQYWQGRDLAVGAEAGAGGSAT